MLILDKVLSEEDIIKHLKSKNVLFKDEEKAKQILEKIGYFKLKEYSYIYRDNSKKSQGKVYKTDTYFEYFYEDFNLDRNIRMKVLEKIELIEIFFKSELIKVLARNNKYDYLNKNTWVDNKRNSEGRVNQIIERLESKAFKILSREEYISKTTTKEYLKKNDNKLPIWVLMQELSFGNMLEIFEIINISLIEKIFKKFYGSYEEFFNHLSLIKEIRNRSAHNNNLILERYLVGEKEISILEVLKRIRYIVSQIYDGKEIDSLNNLIERLKARNDILSFYEV